MFSEYQRAFYLSLNKRDSAVKYALAFMAYADEDISPEEDVALRSALPDGNRAVATDVILRSVKSRKLADALTSFRYLRKLNSQQRVLLMGLLIDMSHADRRLAANEKDVMYFFADSLGFRAGQFEVFYREHTGMDIRYPSDFSDPQFWASLGNGQQQSSDHGEGRYSRNSV